MLQKIKRKKSLLLTAVILAATSVPSYAAEKKPEKEKIKTDAVVVTASRTEQEVKETPTSVEVITGKDIERLGAESVLQALQLALGLDLTETGMVGNQVSIRGAKTNQTLLLIDGRRVRSEDTGSTMNFYELERINIDDVERIEIVRGAASSLYGSEALGGVINIIRKKTDEQKTTLTVDFTSRRKDSGIRYDAGKHGKWNLSTSFKVADYRERDIGDISNQYGKRYFFNIEGRMDMAKDKELDVFADYMKEDLYAKERLQQGADYEHLSFSTCIKYKVSDKRGDYESQFYYTRFHKDQERHYRPTGKFVGFDDMTFDSLIFDARRSMQLTKEHLLTYGGEYRKEDYESTRLKGKGFITRKGITDPLGQNSVNYTALYVQDEWLLNPNWLLIPSLRLDHSSAFGSKVTGKIAATYKLNKNLRFKANFGTAYRAPTTSELYLDWDGMPTGGRNKLWLHGNPDLKPETALNFDLSFEMEKDKTFAKITYFNNRVSDMINGVFSHVTMTPGHPPTPTMHIRYKNEPEVTLQGIELEARQALGEGFLLRGTYTYLDARDNNHVRLFGRPYHKASLQLGYEDVENGWDALFWSDWTVGYLYEEAVGRKKVVKETSPSIVNLVIHKKINDHFSAYLGIDNLLDTYDDTLSYNGRIWRGGVRMTF